ncbi:CDP-2,3-bis-(O-geranylgeranyl)-sn-glycerol synthase [Candidatus Pacearchaeota archaeon]|nr:CDP-2,3-bis-(O-geranylgeranyl)-sn-glycerol synthase [Candidatus Pacearchaeota archaeon]
MDFLIFIFKCFYFMLPAYLANMAPVLTKDHFKELKIPVDFNTKIDHETIFGRHKTFRGLIFGVIYAIITAFVQYLLYDVEFFRLMSLVDYSDWLLLGFLLGSGVVLGDLLESFFKRRLRLKPGKPFIPWDQIDFVIGAMIFVYPIYQLDLMKIITILIISFFLHISINHAAYYLKIRRVKW